MPNSKIDGRVDSQSDARLHTKLSSPWSVRGVSREARSKVAKAAARRRQTIGQWVTNALTQVANKELETSPCRDRSAKVQAVLPVESEEDDPPLGNALYALAERFERSEKRNDAISALTILAERLEAAEQREKSLLDMIQIVAERAERGEERIADITRDLADIAVKLEVALSSNQIHSARNISDSVVPSARATSSEQDEMLAALKNSIKLKKMR